MTNAIWWLRRDLRLTDNQALTAAMKHAGHIVPVFIFDPALLNSPYVGSKRLAFLLDGLHRLDEELQARGSRLIIRRGRPEAVLAALLAETEATAIFAEKDVSPYARCRDTTVARCLPLHLIDSLTVYPPTAVLKDNGDPYVVFTPFKRSWKSLPVPLPHLDDLLPAPESISTPAHLSGETSPTEPELPAIVPFPAGEAEAQRRLKAFVEHLAARGDDCYGIYDYAQKRNRMDLAGTSQLSPYLRFGMLSARQVVAAALAASEQAPTPQARKNAEIWLESLIWREFYFAILHHFPHVRGASFRPAYDHIRWDNDEAAFAAWCEGRTGYPVVDAAMRQLVHSGWMHNRARMIVASFLVKDLLIDWRWGERFFMQHLIDGDPAANNGGWQWTAGTGTDAAPYFRIFNPVLQGEKFDPNGDYIRRWVPELADLPAKFIHTPWQLPKQVQQQTGCLIGQDYPEPVVNHAWARKRVLNIYARAKEKVKAG